ncbi:MAG: DNA/RNA nuclease SfsA [Holosporaceae bacterium]|jgi:sugar fermentation stimulation protein A|nr:DNA/RNA nuclease SfsA [Holosporaceae bacterium]
MSLPQKRSELHEQEMYKFSVPLEYGRVVSRPNRFIMHVERCKKRIVCHCPSTGKIGNIVFDDVPCLLSPSFDKKRKTPYTVEAISVDGAQSWIGINQNAANRYVEYFFKVGMLDGVVKNGHKILREQKIGNSKLDFKIENSYVEVKTPLQFLALTEGDRPSGMECVNSHERFVRHVTELGNRLLEHENAVLLSCFLYDAPVFTPPEQTKRNKIIGDAVRRSLQVGVKMWQVNLSVTPQGVKLLKYFDITDRLIF